MRAIFVIFTVALAITSAVGVQEIYTVADIDAVLEKTKNVAILVYKAGCSGCSTGISLFEAGCAENTAVTCIKTSNLEGVMPQEKDRVKFVDWPWILIFPKGKFEGRKKPVKPTIAPVRRGHSFAGQIVHRIYRPFDPERKYTFNITVMNNEVQYSFVNVPIKFVIEIFSNYGCHREPPTHPFYITTSSEFGYYPPCIHTVPMSFFPRSQRYSSELAKCGMHRNFSLNI